MKQLPFEHFVRRLVEARERLRWTQADLAIKASMQPTAISHFETGRRRPSLANLLKLSKALGVSIDWLLGKTTIMPRTERERKGLPPAPCSPVGSRSGVSFDDLASMCLTNRMEYSKLTKDPCYYHTFDCVMKRKKQCGMTCNGVDGERIAADAAEVKSAGWDNDQRDPHGK